MDRFFNYIFGFSSFFGFLWICVTINKTLQQFNRLAEHEELLKEIPYIIKILSFSILGLNLFFILLIFFTYRTIKQLNTKLNDLPIENAILKQELNHSILNKKTLCSNTHNIMHEYRYLILELDSIMATHWRGDGEVSERDIERALENFESFIKSMLLNISDFFKSFTQDRCSACIKIVKQGKVKTFFRDPLCNRDRKRSDYNQDGTPTIYKVTDNYAFKIITDKTSKSRTFFCDKLEEFKGYLNVNPDWSKLYKACGVVPISKRIKKQWQKNEWNVIGFLCVDNIRGGFETKEAEDFLCAFGDLLYAFLLRYNELISIALEKGMSNEKIKTYSNWDES